MRLQVFTSTKSKQLIQGMATSHKDRINELITALGLSKNKFAKALGSSSAVISKITTTDVNYGIELAERIISTFPSVNPSWLLSGNGEMMLPKTGGDTHLETHPDTHLSKKWDKGVGSDEPGKKGTGDPAEWENDHLFGQSGPKAIKPELTDEERERQAMFNELYNSTEQGAFGQLDELRRNPGYFQTARKLQTLRGKLGHDMSRTEPEAAWAVEKAQVFGMLTHNLLRFHLRYLDTFANASYNYHNTAGPLTETPIESLTYSEYREAMLKEATKLQPYAEAVTEANAKMQEILRLLLPFDNAGLIDQFLID